jgi:hypothetical protein
MPAAAPSKLSTVISVSNWRKIRGRRAPRETRTAISWRRAIIRARFKLATFAHTTSITKKVPPSVILV